MMSPGVYILSHPSAKVSALLYGSADRQSYGFPVSMGQHQLQVGELIVGPIDALSIGKTLVPIYLMTETSVF